MDRRRIIAGQPKKHLLWIADGVTLPDQIFKTSFNGGAAWSYNSNGKLYIQTRGSSSRNIQLNLNKHISLGNCEWEVICDITDANTDSKLGIRLIACNNKDYGGQLFANTHLIAGEGNTFRALQELSLNTEYKIKIRFVDGIAYYYLNDQLLYQTASLSTYYISANRLLFQDVDCYVKYISFRYLETNYS